MSYPNDRSTESMVLVLGDLFPDKHGALGGIAWNCETLPVDICAGRVLAQAIVREMKTNSHHQHDFAETKAEIAAAQQLPEIRKTTHPPRRLPLDERAGAPRENLFPRSLGDRADDFRSSTAS